MNDDGFWIVHTKNFEPKNAPECLRIPWNCVRFRQEKENGQNFQIRGKSPIELWVSNELGTAIQRRSDRYTIEDELR